MICEQVLICLWHAGTCTTEGLEAILFKKVDPCIMDKTNTEKHKGIPTSGPLSLVHALECLFAHVLSLFSVEIAEVIQINEAIQVFKNEY